MAEQKNDTRTGLSFFGRIFRKKNPDEMINETKKNGLKKTLNAFDLTILGIGAIIGSGIFTLSGVAINGDAQAGPSFILSLIIAGTACILAALSYAEFAAMIPVAGSAYTYTFATLGEIVAWLIGWVLMLEYAIGNITVACGWTGYLFKLMEGFKHINIFGHSYTLPAWMISQKYWIYHFHLFDMNLFNHIVPFNLTLNIPAIFIMTVITAILYIGVQESTRTAAIMVVVKLAIIALFLAIGVFYVKPEHWTPFMPNGFKGVFEGAFLIFFAYIGFDAVSTAAEETKNPQRDLPIGIIASLVICTLIYILVAAVLTGMVPYKLIDTHAPVAAAMLSVKQNWTAGLISIGAVAGLTSVLLVLQLGTTRILFAMARDRLLPSVFSKVHPKFKTPHIITIIAGAFVAVGTMFLDLEQAAHLCNIGTFSAFIIVSIAVIVLRVVDPKRERPFKVPFAPFTPILGILICLAIIVKGIPVQTFAFFAVWLLAGLAIYFSYGFRKTNQITGEGDNPIEEPQLETV